MRYPALISILIGTFFIFSCSEYVQNNSNPKDNLEELFQGLWSTSYTNDVGERVEVVAILQDNYIAETFFNKETKRFYQTLGGRWKVTDEAFSFRIDFATSDEYAIGDTLKSKYTFRGSDTLNFEEDEKAWIKLEDGQSSDLANAWFISGRMRNGEIARRPLRPRKTMKILSDTRFQWVAYNDETGEFSGTGGGTYTAKDGKYIENIDFFSRDSSRVGASLSFDYEVIDGEWHHKGLSSRGDSIYEIWSPIEKMMITNSEE